MSAAQYLIRLLACARPPLWAVAATGALLVAPTVVHAQGSTEPEITSTGPFTVTEGETAVATLVADDSDTDAVDLVWSKTGGADSDDFTLSSAGVLAFAAAKDYEDPDDSDSDGSYQVTVQVSDGTNTDTANLVVTLANAIELTAITGPAAVTFAENGGGRVATFSASSDADREGVQWLLTGNDADHFMIDSPPGALRFHIDPDSPQVYPSPPDFEDPDDADTSNDYSISLLARVGSTISSPFSVTVTVTDVDEAGEVTFSTTRPAKDTALTATLTDPDGVTPGTTTWQWERTTGPDEWMQIDGATAASYTPTAADTGAYLRVTATYDDEHGSGHTAVGILPHVVTGPLLSSLSVSGSDRDLAPAFDPSTLHYFIECSAPDTITLTLSASDAATRLSVNGTQYASQNAMVTLTGLSSDDDILVDLAGPDGGSTRYVVHCVHDDYPATSIISRSAGAWEGLIVGAVASGFGPTATSFLMVIDTDGVPRFHRRISGFVPHFRPTGGKYPFGYIRQADEREIVLLGTDLAPALTLGPPASADSDEYIDNHDFLNLPNGNTVMVTTDPTVRDMSGFTDSLGNTLTSTEPARDEIIREVAEGGSTVFTWNPWSHIQMEDCLQRWRPEEPFDYMWFNSIEFVDGGFLLSYRGCSSIIMVDRASEDVRWRLGTTNVSDAEWLADGLEPPLDIINDPYSEFCGQHSAKVVDGDRLLFYDNGAVCVLDLETGEPTRENDQVSRVVEYALDLDNDEAVFLRQHSFDGTFDMFTLFTGLVAPIPNGRWLISWGGGITWARGDESDVPTITEADPETGEELLHIGLSMGGTRRFTRSYPLQPSMIAPTRAPLTASLPASETTSVFHTGATDSPQVVVAFSRPVVDFDETSPSLSVSGGTIDSVSAHVVAGEPAHAYLVTLTPDGDGAITFSLVTSEACADGGICTADGATLSSVPSALVIGAPATVSFGQAAYSVGEGGTRSVTVQLSSAHQGVRAVTIPVELETTAGASAADLTAEESVTFAAGETSKTLTVEALDDDLVEGEESATLEFGTLPHGVTAGSTDTATITVTDADLAQFSSSLAQQQVAEGGEVALTFTITNGVTFEDDQTVELSLGGSATPEDDYTLVDEGNQTLTAPYELTFPSGAGSVSVTVRVVDDSEIEHEAETITLRGTLASTGAAVGATHTLTIPPSDVPDTPEVSIAAGSTVTEGEAATFMLTRTASTSIPFSSPLTVSVAATERGSTLGAGPPTTARFEAGDAVVDVLVPTLDDRVVEPAGEVTLLILGSTSNPPIYLTRGVNAATVAVNDNDVAAFTLSADAEEVAEGSAVQVTIAAAGVTFAEAQTLALTLAGTAMPGDDFSLAADGDELSDPYTVALPAGAIAAVVTVQTARDGEDDVGETIELTVSHDGSAVGAVTITIGAPPPAPVSFSSGGGGGGGGPTGPTPSDVDFEWTVKRDIEALDAGHATPTGMWSDGAVLWLLHNGDGADDAVYAYDLESGERVEDREIALDERNRAPRGIWPDGKGTAWVSDSGRERLFAYDLTTGERLEDRDIELAGRNADARGIWSDSETMWVLDERRNAVFAYDLESGEFLAEYALDPANGSPTGIWADGVTLWVSDPGSSPRRLFAYRVPTRGEVEAAGEDASLERVRDEEFDNLSQASNNSPRGIWSDGAFMYVADASDGKVYTYNMPDAIDARLASLTLSGIDIGEFDPDRTDYEGVIGEDVTETTVEAGAVQRQTDIAIDPPDADERADGHQVSLAGMSEIAITVTSADSTRRKTYRVTVEQPPVELALSPMWTSFEWPGPDGVALTEAGLPEEVVVVYTWDETTGSWLGYFPGLDNVPGLNTLTTFSSGVAYWVAATEPVVWTLGRTAAGAE